MKKIIVILFILSFTASALAATVGSPEISIPEESLYLKKEAVNKTLDRYGYNMDIKGTAELDFVFKRKLTSADDVKKAELKGQNYMLKLSSNFYDSFEPYIKLGTSDLEVTWTQNGENITVEAKPGFVWAAGIKAHVYEFKNYGIKLTMDAQYKNADLDVDTVSRAGSMNEKFEIKEYQIALLASKKLIVPVGINDYYVVPYTGLTVSWSDVDVSFEIPPGPPYALFSTFNASDENVFGLVLGCDIMPSLLSWYLLNLELRFINETALTLGGTVKF